MACSVWISIRPCASFRGAGLHAPGWKTSSKSPIAAREYLEGDPELILLDSSHEYQATLDELDLWYAALEPGGLLALHDVSQFAVDFDVTHQGGVKRAFTEWRKAQPGVETFCLNGDARTMDLPRPFYKDACGVGLIHKALS
jgi:hypothetical protein